MGSSHSTNKTSTKEETSYTYKRPKNKRKNKKKRRREEEKGDMKEEFERRQGEEGKVGEGICYEQDGWGSDHQEPSKKEERIEIEEESDPQYEGEIIHKNKNKEKILMKNPNIIGNWNQLYKILVKKIELSKAFKVYFPNKKLIENNESLKHHVNNFENRTTRSILRHFNIYPENSPKKTYNALFKKVKEEIIKIIQRMIIDEEPKPTPEKLKELIINKIELKKCPSYISDPLISSLKKSKTSSTIERSGCRDLSLLTQLLPSSDDEDPDDLKTPRSSENSEESPKEWERKMMK